MSAFSWTEDKENQLPHFSYARGTLSLPLIDDELTSGESPDLGIGSDGQFSSLERLGGSLAPQGGLSHRGFPSESKKERKDLKLCSDPSNMKCFLFVLLSQMRSVAIPAMSGVLFLVVSF